jgi:hypothetical protein
MVRVSHLSMSLLLVFAAPIATTAFSSPTATTLANGLPANMPVGTIKLSTDAELWTHWPNKSYDIGQKAWDFDAHLDGEQVVWQHDNGRTWEIWAAARGKGCRQITNGASDAESPDVSGGLIAWSGFDGQAWQIFVSNGGGSPVQITQGRSDSEFPRVSNGRVAWYTYERRNVAQVYLWDSRTDQITQITSGVPSGGPVAIDGDELVWMGSDGRWFQIYYLNLATGERRQLTNDKMNHRLPAIHDGLVAWDAGDGKATEVFVWGHEHGLMRITNNQWSDCFVDAHARRVVWETYSSRPGIMVWDATVEPPVTFQFTDRGGGECNPRTNGSWVVWDQRETQTPKVRANDPDANRMRRVHFRGPNEQCNVFIVPNLDAFCAVARVEQGIQMAYAARATDDAYNKQLCTEAEAALAALRTGAGDTDGDGIDGGVRIAQTHLTRIRSSLDSARGLQPVQQAAFQRIRVLIETALRALSGGA